MLRRLTVENYALIEKLDMELDARLNIITGETGAGKSILLGALGLLLGNKNESGTLRDVTRNCVIEGVFDLTGYGLEAFFDDNDLDYEPQTVVRRMISPSGKSRAFVNDMPVQLAVLRELGGRLIDIHSQHQNLVLSDEAFRIRSVDALAGAAAEIGVALCTLALVTGSIWARHSWNVWWTWDPRLTTALVLWFLYAGYLVLRRMDLPEPRRAALCAVVGIVAFADVPLVFLSARLWRSIHPAVFASKGGGLEPEMLTALLVSLLSFGVFWAALLCVRTSQIRAGQRLDALTFK